MSWFFQPLPAAKGSGESYTKSGYATAVCGGSTPPKFVGSTQASGTGTSVVSTRPAGLRKGDMQIAIVVTDAAVTLTKPAAFNWIAQHVDAASNCRASFLYKAVETGDSETETWTLGAGGNAHVVIAVWRGADNVSPSGQGTNFGSTPTPSLTGSPGTRPGYTLVGMFAANGASLFPATPDSSPAASERLEYTNANLSTLITYIEDYAFADPGASTVDATFSASAPWAVAEARIEGFQSSARAVVYQETGVGSAQPKGFGVAVRIGGTTYAKSGWATVGGVASAADIDVDAETGFGKVAGVGGGVSAAVDQTQGYGVVGGVGSGASASVFVETGYGLLGEPSVFALIGQGAVSGFGAGVGTKTGGSTYTKSGWGKAGPFGAGADATTRGKSGYGTAGGVGSGPETKGGVKAKAGGGVAGLTARGSFRDNVNLVYGGNIATAMASSYKWHYWPAGTYNHSAYIDIRDKDVLIEDATITGSVGSSAALIISGVSPKVVFKGTCVINRPSPAPHDSYAVEGAGIVIGSYGWATSNVVLHADNLTINDPWQVGVFCHATATATITGLITSNRSGRDSFSTTGGSTDIDWQAELHAVDSGDDGVSVVSYDTESINARIHFSKVYVTGSQVDGRGISCVGGEDVQYDWAYVENTAGAGIYVACEPSYNSLGVDGVTVLYSKVVNPNTLGTHPSNVVLYSGRVGYTITNINVRVDYDSDFPLYSTSGSGSFGTYLVSPISNGLGIAGAKGSGVSAKVVGSNTYTKAGVGILGVPSVMSRTGRGTVGLVGSGADAATSIETGFGKIGAAGFGSGTREGTATKSGYATVGTVGSGSDADTSVESGFAAVAGVGAGARSRTLVRSGFGAAGGVGSGADAATSVETGYGKVSGVGAGSRSEVKQKSGYGAASGVGIGSENHSVDRTGFGSVAAVGSGASAVSHGVVYTKAGCGIMGAPSVLSRTGYGKAQAAGFGTGASVDTETGFGKAGASGSGSHTGETTKTGYAKAAGVGAGTREAIRSRSGFGTVGAVAAGVATKPSVYVKTGFGILGVPSTLIRSGRGVAGGRAGGVSVFVPGPTFTKTGFGLIGDLNAYGTGPYGETPYGGGTEANGMIGSGSRVVVHVRSGFGSAGGVAAGQSVSVEQQTGAGVLGTVGAGSLARVIAKSGFAAAGLVGAGSRAEVHARSSWGAVGSVGSGAKVFTGGTTYAKTGFGLLGEPSVFELRGAGKAGSVASGAYTKAKEKTGYAKVGADGHGVAQLIQAGVTSKAGFGAAGLTEAGARAMVYVEAGSFPISDPEPPFMEEAAGVGLRGFGTGTKAVGALVKSGFAKIGADGHGADVDTAVETGAGLVGGVGSGSSASVEQQTGYGTVGGVGAGTRERSRERSGYGVVGTVGTATRSTVHVKAGFATVGCVASGADVDVSDESGFGKLGTVGAGQGIKVGKDKTGFGSVQPVAYGASASDEQQTGTGVVSGAAAGSRAVVHVRSGYATVGGVGSGTESRAATTTKTGFASVGASGSGTRSVTRARTGAATVGTVGSGTTIRSASFSKAGYAVVSGLGGGSRSRTSVRASGGVLGTQGSGLRAIAVSRAGWATVSGVGSGVGMAHKVGALGGWSTAGLTAAGIRERTIQRSGTATAGGTASGSRAGGRERAGEATVGTTGSGSRAVLHVRSGGATASLSGFGPSTSTVTRTGYSTVGTTASGERRVGMEPYGFGKAGAAASGVKVFVSWEIETRSRPRGDVRLSPQARAPIHRRAEGNVTIHDELQGEVVRA